MRLLATFSASAGLCLAAGAHASQVLYQNDFESGTIDSHWSSSAHLDTSTTLFTKFMGRFSNNAPPTQYNNVILTIPSTPPPTGNNGGGGGGGGGQPYTLSFDFYCLDSWDGNSTTIGPDLFEVYINNTNYFSYTFTNNGPGYTQSYPVLPTIGPSLLAFNAMDKDSIYRNITIPFSVGTATSIAIKWQSTGLQGIQDESWGIDNVSVNYNAPTPGSLALLGLGGLTLARRRR